MTENGNIKVEFITEFCINRSARMRCRLSETSPGRDPQLPPPLVPPKSWPPLPTPQVRRSVVTLVACPEQETVMKSKPAGPADHSSHSGSDSDEEGTSFQGLSYEVWASVRESFRQQIDEGHSVTSESVCSVDPQGVRRVKNFLRYSASAQPTTSAPQEETPSAS